MKKGKREVDINTSDKIRSKMDELKLISVYNYGK